MHDRTELQSRLYALNDKVPSNESTFINPVASPTSPTDDSPNQESSVFNGILWKKKKGIPVEGTAIENSVSNSRETNVKPTASLGTQIKELKNVKKQMSDFL